MSVWRQCVAVAATAAGVLCAVYAQQTQSPWLYVGGYAAYQNNIQSADFQSLPNAFRCGPNYTTGAGSALSVGALATYPLTPDMFFAELRAGFAPLSGQLARNEVIGNTADIGGRPSTTPAESRHELSTTLPALTLEPSIGALVGHRIRLGVGLRLSYLLRHTFEQVETLIQPDYVFFLPDSSRQRNRVSGDIGNIYRLQAHLSLSAGVDLPLSPTLTLTPELRYHHPLVRVTRDVDWRILPIAFGISVRRALFPPPPPRWFYDTVYVRDTVLVRQVGLQREEIVRLSSTATTTTREERQGEERFIYSTATITEHYERRVPRPAVLQLRVAVRPLRDDGTSADSIGTVVVEEIEEEESFPLLPYVYFPEGSSLLAMTRMTLLDARDTASFSEQNLPPATLEIYRHLLNIVGKRLRNNPRAQLVVTGTNADVGVEAGNLQLSQARAMAVRDYLVSVWGIEPSRIVVRARNLPASPSNNTIPEGQEENRRVELSSNDPAILAPVSIAKFSVRATPPALEIVPQVEAEAGLAGWTLAIEQGGRTLRRAQGTEPEPYRWRVAESPYPKLDEPVSMRYAVIDRTGQVRDTTVLVNVQQLTVRQKRFEQRDDKRIDRFSLIVFEFNKAELTPAHRQLLQEVRSRITPQSKVTIYGYTDRSGEPDYNKELARRRCVEVQRALGLPDSMVKLEPKGSEEPLYTNSIPEGRAYSRTVQIVIETPLGNGAQQSPKR